MDKDLELAKPTTSTKPNGTSVPPTLDPNLDPRQWPIKRKVTVNFALCLSVLSLTYSSTAYVSSLQALEEKYHMSQELAVSGVTFFVLGFAAGPLLCGPASEIYGRRPVYTVAGVGYSAFLWGCPYAPNAAALLIFRFFAGFFGSATINNVPASIGDFTTLAERGVYSILYALCAFGGPATGPLTSEWVDRYAGSRWNFLVQAIFGTIMSVAIALVPETHAPTLLRKQNALNGQPAPKLSTGQIMARFRTGIFRPFKYLATEPIVTLVSLYLTILYGILYGFFEAFEVVYVGFRHFTSTSFGLTYIALALGFLLACVCLATFGVSYYTKRATLAAKEGRPTPPEARLGMALIGAIVVPTSLLIFTFTAGYRNVHWFGPVFAEFLFGFGMLSIFTGFIPYLIDCYQSSAASALAAAGFSRATVGCVFPLFSVQMYQRLTIPGASGLLTGIAALCSPLPFIFLTFGPRIRAKSNIIGT